MQCAHSGCQGFSNMDCVYSRCTAALDSTACGSCTLRSIKASVGALASSQGRCWRQSESGVLLTLLRWLAA